MVRLKTALAPLLALVTAATLAVGCSSPSEPAQRVGDRCVGGTSHTSIVSKLAFARQKEGVTAGFDIDGFTSDGFQSEQQETLSCSQMDFEDANGKQGIDNQLARLMPLLDTVTAADVNLIIKGAIENGQLLTTVTLDGVDDLQNDPCVEVTFKAALGTPTLGTDDELDPSQTFEHDTTGPTSRAIGAIKDGYLEVGPFELDLLVVVFAEKFNLHLSRARVRTKLDPSEPGRMVGAIGGGVKIQELEEIIQQFDLNSGERDAAANFIKGLGDLDYDPATKKCGSISVGVTMSGRRAYLVPGTPVADAGTSDAGTPVDAGPVDAGPKTPDEEAWERDVLPIARETCLQCHAVTFPGRPLLTTYAAWTGNRNLIKQVVITEQRMPPATVPLTDARRTTIEDWLNRAF
jgi:cytochrome c5